MGGSKTVLKSSWFGSLVVLSFGIAFLVVLGSSWGRFWALRGSFWCFFGISTHRFNPSTHQFVDSTHQLINPPIQLIKPSSHRLNPSTHRFNSSTHQPMALRHFLTRPGGLRAARLNKKYGWSRCLFGKDNNYGIITIIIQVIRDPCITLKTLKNL